MWFLMSDEGWTGVTWRRTLVESCLQLSAQTVTWESWTWVTTTCRIQEWSCSLMYWRVHTVDWRSWGQWSDTHGTRQGHIEHVEEVNVCQSTMYPVMSTTLTSRGQQCCNVLMTSLCRLSFCGVTEEGCASLASALSSNCRLRELDLSFNHPGDTVLSGPLCRLEKLKLVLVTDIFLFICHV